MIDERPDGGAVAHAVADDQCTHSILQFGSERVVDTVFDKDAIGTDTRLTSVAEFGDHGTGDGSIEIGVGKDDERGVPTQFHGYFLDRAGALLEQ